MLWKLAFILKEYTFLPAVVYKWKQGAEAGWR
jgi:hypothetical protein